MALMGALFLVAGFLLLVNRLRLVEKSKEVLVVARASAADFLDSDLSDDVKETALRRHAIKLFTLFLYLTAGLACALLLPTAVVWTAGEAGILSFPSVTSMVISWEFILGTSFLFIAGGVGLRTAKS